MRSESDSLLRVVLGIAAIGVILVTLNAVAQVANMLLLGFVLAICFAPVMDWINRRGVGRGLSMILASLLLFIGGFGLLIFIYLSFARLASSMPQYAQDMAARLEGYDTALVIAEQLAALELSTEQMASISLDLIVRAANNIYLLGFTLIISVFMLWERLLLPDKIHRYLAPDGRVLTTFKVLSVDISRFVLITAKANFLSASGDTILLLIIGVDFAFLWGVLSFFLGFIPSIGFLLSLIPPMILAFLEFGWQAALAVLLGYWIINGIADNVIKPKFVGVGLNLSPMVVFLALVIWGWPLGLMGALLSIPLTMIVYRSILQPLDSTRWLANMMRYGVDDQSESDAISAAASETPS